MPLPGADPNVLERFCDRCAKAARCEREIKNLLERISIEDLDTWYGGHGSSLLSVTSDSFLKLLALDPNMTAKVERLEQLRSNASTQLSAPEPSAPIRRAPPETMPKAGPSAPVLVRARSRHSRTASFFDGFTEIALPVVVAANAAPEVAEKVTEPAQDNVVVVDESESEDESDAEDDPADYTFVILRD
jgi:hypothetical protein